MVSTVFKFLILSSAICFGSGIDMDMFDIIFFRTGIIVLFISSLRDTRKRELPPYSMKIIVSLMAIVIANLFIHTFAPMVLHTSFNLFLFIVGLCTVYSYWDQKENASLVRMIIIAAAINLILFICQKIGFNPVFNQMPYKGQEGAFLGNQPRLMTYFAVVTPFLWWPLMIISVALGIYTQQIIIFVPVMLCLFFKLETNRQKIIFSGIIAVILILLHKNILSSLSFRMANSWYPVLTEFFKRPLLGFGLGVRPIPELEVVGNSYLQFIIGAGIIGAGWIAYFVRSIYRKLDTGRESIVLVSLAIIALVEYPIEIPKLWFLIMAILVINIIKFEETNAQ